MIVTYLFFTALLPTQSCTTSFAGRIKCNISVCFKQAKHAEIDAAVLPSCCSCRRTGTDSNIYIHIYIIFVIDCLSYTKVQLCNSLCLSRSQATRRSFALLREYSQFPSISDATCFIHSATS